MCRNGTHFARRFMASGLYAATSLIAYVLLGGLLVPMRLLPGGRLTAFTGEHPAKLEPFEEVHNAYVLDRTVASPFSPYLKFLLGGQWGSSFFSRQSVNTLIAGRVVSTRVLTTPLTRRQIHNLVLNVRASRIVAYLLITHDIFLARARAHRVGVTRRAAVVWQGVRGLRCRNSEAYVPHLRDATLRLKAWALHRDARESEPTHVARSATPEPALPKSFLSK